MALETADMQTSRWFLCVFLICCCACGCAQSIDELSSRCPSTDNAIQATCKEIAYKDLPDGAKALLRKLKCDTPPNPNYDDGSAVDLNGDGSLEYQFCCKAAPHGPCGSVVIGKVGGQWKDLGAGKSLLGFEGACNGFVVLTSEHSGFHDICQPVECAPESKTSEKCAPMIWQFENGSYQPVKPAGKPSP